ncbi:MAG: formate dehydrogenase accessory protein FdhE [Chloroflexota bacterium]
MIPATDEQILKRLNKAEKKDGTLPKPLQFFRELVSTRAEVKDRIGILKPSISTPEASKRLELGSPLLVFAELNVDWKSVRDLYQQVANLLAKYADVFENVPPAGKEPSLADLIEAARAWFEGHAPSPDSEVAPVVLSAAMHPFLTAYREALAGLVNQEQWLRGYCPVCGGNPDLAYIEPDRGERRLICSRCDMEWAFKRLECPCCGNQDEKTLAFYTDDSGRYRLYVCENCRHYLKAVDLRKAPPDVLFPIERVLTVNVDVQARDDGYLPCTECRREQWSTGAAVTSPDGNQSE